MIAPMGCPERLSERIRADLMRGLVLDDLLATIDAVVASPAMHGRPETDTLRDAARKARERTAR